MHYYSFHIKDYYADTAHLSNEEDLCFRRLLDMYYDTEAPIPLKTDWVSRRIRVGIESVTFVLSEFFILTENGWTHARCDDEITAYRAKAEVARQNGKAGGRPKKTQRVTDGNLRKTGSKANQEPLTINQEPLTIETSIAETASGIPPCPIDKIISIYHEVLPSHPKFMVRNAKRDSHFKARWKQFYDEGDFKTAEEGLLVFRWLFNDLVKKSDFLTGRVHSQGHKPFVASLDWIMKADNFAKIIERKYT